MRVQFVKLCEIEGIYIYIIYFVFSALILIIIKSIRLPNENGSEIPMTDLPSCRQCQSLVRPHVVWFGESLWPDILKKIDEEIGKCDLFLVVCLSLFFSLFDLSLKDKLKVGTSSIVYPAALYASLVAKLGIPVAEVNIESTPSTSVST